MIRVAADEENSVSVVQSTNGYPWHLGAAGIVVCCDPTRQGGLAYYEPAKVFSGIRAGEEPGGLEYAHGYAGIVKQAWVDLNVGGILQVALKRGAEAQYDEGRRLLRLTSQRGSSVEVSLDKNATNAFGVERFELISTDLVVSVSDIHLDAGPLLNLTNLTRHDVEGMGLPLRLLSTNEFNAFPALVPKDFPQGAREIETAERLRKWLDSRLAR